MKLNPEKLIWTKPTKTVAGDAIPEDRVLEYEVGTVDAGEDPQALMVVPGQLRSGEEYEAPIGDLGLEDGEHTLVLRSFYKEDPELKSQWSEAVTFRVDGSVPKPPLDVFVD